MWGDGESEKEGDRLGRWAPPQVGGQEAGQMVT